MYDSLSDESKCFFHPGFLGFESITLNWLLAQFALAVSSFSFSKRLLLRVYPFAALLAIVSTDESGKIVGFAFVKRKSHSLKEISVGELGIFVREDRQKKGVGSGLMATLLGYAENDCFQRIYLTVLTRNIKAMSLYKKYGFKLTRKIPEGDIWRGKRFGSVEFCLCLS